MLAVLFPGQGSQLPGLLSSWLDQPGAARLVEQWSAATGLDLARAGTDAGAEELRDTALAQPLLAATGLLSAAAALRGALPDLVCGHSVGELPALALAAVLDPRDVLTLAAVRGRAMAGAAAAGTTGLSALLGAGPEAALALPGVALATVNGPGQVVVGGSLDALSELADAPPPGMRVRPLDVAGAFHTLAMQPAVAEFQDALAALVPRTTAVRVVANADGAVLTDGSELLRRLPGQLTGPVRFDHCLQAMAALGVTGVLEAAPGGVLSALARRALPGVDVVALRSAEDLPEAWALVAAHAQVVGERPQLGWRTVQSPEAGRVDLLLPAGGTCATGEPIAVVSGRSGSCPVPAPAGGQLTEWLVCAGDPVRAGQPLGVLA